VILLETKVTKIFLQIRKKERMGSKEAKKKKGEKEEEGKGKKNLKKI
jgi:hypothetical protein